MLNEVSLWIAAILTIAISTLVWKDQPVSKTAEHLYVAVITGNLIVMAWGNIKNIGLMNIANGKLIYIIPVILGVMAYTRYSKQYFWLYRYPISLVVGMGLATSMRGHIGGSILDQLKDSFFNLSVPGDAFASFNNLVMLILLCTTLSFFIFTIKATRSPIVIKMNVFSRYSMMAAFGYTFGATLATRINQYAGRIQFLLFEWLKLGA